MFKELAEIKPPGKIRAILRKFGIAPSCFYTLKTRYMLYGVWGLCDLVQTTKCGEMISPDLELQIIEERLINPTLSPEKMLEKFDLKCSTSNMKKIYARWGLSRFKKPLPLRGIVPETIPKFLERPSMARQSAKTLFPQLIEEKNLKVHSEFNEFLKRIGRRDVIISNPGAIIMAPFINQLGIVEALHSYGPLSRLSVPITNQIIVNVLRIIVGFPSIHDFTLNSDRSVAIGSGMTLNPTKTRFYEYFDQLRFRHLEGFAE